MADQEQIAAIYDAYVGRVYAYVRARVPSDQDAEDLTAETFLRAIGGLGRFAPRHDGAEAAWLFRIAHNQVANHHRAAARRRALSLEELPMEPPAPDQPADEAERAEQRRRLLATLARLSPRHQEVVALKYFGGLRNQEIAAALGLDQRTVGAHLSRALAELQLLLGGPAAASAWEAAADAAPAHDPAQALRAAHTGLPHAAAPPLAELALLAAAPTADDALRARLRARLRAPRPGPLAWLRAWLRR
jgi:RNA polymerase sigma-70 factor, ECF subfamily